MEELKLLREKYPEYSFAPEKPDFLSSILPMAEDLIFCYKEGLSTSTSSGPYSVSCHDSVSYNSEVLEKPLEMNFESLNVTIMQNSSKDEEDRIHRYLPVDPNVARDILNYSNLKLKPSKEVWVLTEPHNKNVLLGCHKSDGWVKMYWVEDHSFSEKPSLENCLLVHRNIAGPSSGLTVSTQSRNSTILCDTMLINGTKLELSLVWNVMSSELPVNKDTESVLKVVSRIDQGFPDLFVVWQQLDTLQQLLKIARSDDLFNESLPTLSGLTPSSSMDRSSRIRYFIQILPKASQYKISEDNISVQSVIGHFTKSKRDGLDVLDNIWYLFTECSSVKELLDCFSLLFKEVNTFKGTGKILLLNSSRLSRTADIITGAVPCIAISNPVEYLIELGIEKLTKEFNSIISTIKGFLGTPLTAPNASKFSNDTVDDWHQNAEAWLLWLYQMLGSLCTLSVVQPYISVPFIPCLVDSIIDIFTGSSSPMLNLNDTIANPSFKLSLQVPINQIPPQFTDIRRFDETVVTFSSKSANIEVLSAFYFYSKYIFPSCMRRNDLENHKDATVHCPRLHCINQYLNL